MASSKSDEPNMNWANKSQRQTGAGYRGVKHSDDQLVQMFRTKLSQRGVRGIFGIQRIFKVMDDDNSGSLDIQEFWKGICDFRLQISQEECRALFDKFDINGDGMVQYDELLSATVGEMSQYRKEIVIRCFKKFDRDGSGKVDMRDLEGVYNAKSHPEVKSGVKSEQEVLAEFLDTFELHYSLLDSSARDGSIDLKEFLEYYRNVGASIDNDEHFVLMLTNAWNLNDQTFSKGYGVQL